MLLIHGARARRNVVIVALAANLVRIAWAIIRRGVRFDGAQGAPAAV